MDWNTFGGGKIKLDLTIHGYRTFKYDKCNFKGKTKPRFSDMAHKYSSVKNAILRQHLTGHYKNISRET